MALTVNSADVGVANGSAVTSLAAVLASNISVGDLLILEVSQSFDQGITTPAGWTSIVAIGDGNGGGRSQFFRRVATGSDAVTVSFGGSCTATIICNRITGYDTSAPINVSGSNSGTTNSIVAITSPSVTTTVNGCAILRCGSARETMGISNPILNTASGATTSGTGATDITANVCYAIQSSLGATGTAAFIANPGSGNREWTALTIAIAPSPASLDQEGFRFRNDDGSETTATWLASQDSNITQPLSTNTRLRTIVDVTDGDPASTQYQLEWNRSALDSVYRPIQIAGGGSLAFGTAGSATTTGTTAPTVAYPASIVKGDLLVLTICNRPSTSTPSTPSGWNADSNYTQTGGAGSEAAGTGIIRTTVFWKEADGTETGSLSLTLTSGTSVGARMFRYTKTTGKLWSISLANGADNSAGTSYSVTAGSDPGIVGGDMLIVASGTSEDTATMASEAVSATGVTFGTMTEQTDTAITTGNDCHLTVADFAVTSGTSSAAPVYTMTASGTNAANTAGSSIFMRIRQTDAPIQLAASSNISASGENTTAQLTAPSGKTTGDFVTGRMQDDENPADTVDIGSAQYSEFEWCFSAVSGVAVNGHTYQFKVTSTGIPFSAYSQVPTMTIGSGGVIDDESGLTYASLGW